MMQKVSIIVPVFNGSKHISGVFDFFAEQSYENFEVIFVVDKKTTDDSLKLIEGEKHRVSDIKVIIQDDDGKLGGARNEGLRNSNGDIIWFMDVDDKPALDILEYLVHVMESNDADIVMFNSIRSGSGNIKMPDRNYKVDVMNRKDAILALLNLKIPITAWSKIIRKRLLVDNNIEFTHGYAEDIEHTYHSVDRSKTICFCERPLYIYIQNEGSICNSGKHNNARGKAEIAAYERLQRFFSDDPEIIDRFCKRSAIIRMRSAVHMDRENFIAYVKSENCRSMIRKNLSGSISPEVILFKYFPSLYYSFVESYMDIVYYRDKKYFIKPRRA